VTDFGWSIGFDALTSADLFVDRYYHGGRAGNAGDDPLARLVPVGNQGGFRFNGTPREGSVRLAVLVSSGREPDWPDELDEQTGIFTYYGDNRSPGKDLHQTPRGGNLLLRDVFARCYGTRGDRRTVPPFLLFTNVGTYRDMRFRGLLAPGSATSQPDDDLQAIWRTKSGQRFQNYRARFSVLDVATVSRAWIDEVLAGDSLGTHCPEAWRRWVDGRAYQTLIATPTTVVRDRGSQTPTDEGGRRIVAAIHQWFAERPHDFEICAVEVWRMIAPATGRAELTRPSRDGGRDAVGEYKLGPPGDRIALDFALEAKCYGPTNGVGVRDMSRLISRLRHRMFGVFVTTSYFDRQAYEEVRTDGHPVVLICASDILEALRAHGYTTLDTVQSWFS
jgi:hypothetical protein